MGRLQERDRRTYQKTLGKQALSIVQTNFRNYLQLEARVNPAGNNQEGASFETVLG